MEPDQDEENKIEITGSDPTCLTFVLRDEDHTLGNALRYMLTKNPQVKFCGYSIPHPSENIMNIRVETFGAPATDVFRQGLLDLREVAAHLRSTFQAENQRMEQLQQ